MSIRTRTLLNSTALLVLSALSLLSAGAAVKPSPLDAASSAPAHPTSITTQLPQFQQPTLIPTATWPAGIESADLNKDGIPDLIYTDYGATSTASTTHILLNNADGTFTPGQTIATAGAAIAVADFNRDGTPDLEWVSAVQSQGRVYFARGKGDGTFAPAIQLGTFALISGSNGTALPQFTFVTAARMHDTGYLDLLLEDTANSALFELTADASNTLVRIYGIHLPDGTGPISTADLNNDGHTDLLIQTASSVDVFLGSADGILSTSVPYSTGSGVHSAILQDIDGDSHPDLLLETTSGTIAILHGFPDGTFSTTSSGGTNTLDPATGAGGHLIAAMPQAGSAQFLYTATAAGISVLNLDPRLSATLDAIYNAGPAPGSGHATYVVADFNNDGTPDIALDSPEGIAILFNNADGILQSSRSFSANAPALGSTLGNFTGSGNIDAIVMTDGPPQLLSGTGNGTFSPAIPASTSLPGLSPLALPSALPGIPTNRTLSSVVTADLDRDGYPDYIATFDNPAADHAHPISAAYNQIVIWYGKAGGTFSNPSILVPARNYNQVAAIDLENVGLSDLVLTDGYLVSILRNLGHRTFAPEQHLLAGTSINTISTADLNQDGTNDLVLTNGAKTRTSGLNTGGVTVLLNRLGPRALTSTTTAIIVTTPVTITFGQEVDGYAQVTSADSTTPTGTISFFDGTRNICTIPVQNIITCPASAGTGFVAGTHLLTAVYSGDATHSGSTSTAAIVTVLPAATTATLTTWLNPAPAAQPVTFTATLTAAFATPTGPITFFDGNTPIGTASLTSAAAANTSVASFTTSNLAAGTHIITAVYAATPNFTASSSPALTQVITPAATGIATAVMIASSANPAVAGASINLTATVVPVTPAAGKTALTGTITFLDGTVTLGTATLNSTGLATLTTSSLTVGHHLITASYSGAASAATSFLPSLSPVFDQAINAAPLPTAVSFLINASSSTVATGGSTNVLVKVVPLNGFNQAVQLQCRNLPASATCTFAATTVPSGGGATTLKLTTLAPRDCGAATAYNQAANTPHQLVRTLARHLSSSTLPYAAPTLAGLLVFFLPKRRRLPFNRRQGRGLLTLIATAGLLTLAGCGACTDLGTRPGTYTIQVVGTSMGGTQVTVTQNVQITVTE